MTKPDPKKRVRIIKRCHPDGRIDYVIQQRGFLFGWRDAWLESWLGAVCKDSFPTLEEARENLCYFDGSVCTEEEVT